jgi:tetratricopeptide (TPR) repeat protein
LGRWQASTNSLQPVIARGHGDFATYCFLYVASIAQDDQSSMQSYLDAARKNLQEGEMARLQFTQAEVAAFYGKFRISREISERSQQIASNVGLKQNAGAMAGQEALWESQVGDRSAALEHARKTLTNARGIDGAVNGAIALAAAGDIAGAQAIVESLGRDDPQDTILNAVSVPLIRSSIELQRGSAAQAIELLKPSQPYELGFGFLYYPTFMPTYTRAQAYLKLRDGAKAATEFRKVLDHRGLDPVFPVYALAHLGLGRAYALTGDFAQSTLGLSGFLHSLERCRPRHSHSEASQSRVHKTAIAAHAVNRFHVAHWASYRQTLPYRSGKGSRRNGGYTSETLNRGNHRSALPVGKHPNRMSLSSAAGRCHVNFCSLLPPDGS